MTNLRIKNRHLCFADILACFMSYVLILVLVFSVPKEFQIQFKNALPMIAISAAVFAISLFVANLYRVDWVYAGVK